MMRTLMCGVLVVVLLAGTAWGDVVDAWIDYGLTGEDRPASALVEASDFRMRLRGVDPAEAEAMLWALARRGEVEPQTLLDVSMLARIPERTRLAAVMSLAEYPKEESYVYLLALVATGAAEDSVFERLVTWRAILAMPKPDMRSVSISPDKMVLAHWVQEPSEEDRGLWPLYLAAVYQVGEAIASRKPPGHELGDATRLASVEAADVWGYRFMDSERPALERVLTTRIDVNFRVVDMRDAFGSDQPGVAELALLTVQERLGVEDRAALLGWLRAQEGERAMRSALLLGTLNAWGGGPMLVPRDLPESLDGYGQLLRASDQAEALPHVAVQFARADSSAAGACLLVLLERGYFSEAMGLLFPLEGEPVLDVRDWLVEERGWHLLEKHLPEGSPGFWLYGDEAVQAFQLRVLKRWWGLAVERGGVAERGVIR
ncbi:hypothetical protein [Mucisphaera calidilacus]|nr:hypothetical protein [Mucisphaera calidilacus]